MRALQHIRGRGRLGGVALAALLWAAAAPGAEAGMPRTVKLPKRLMLGPEALEEIHLQTGIRYAHPPGVVVRQLDASAFRGRLTVGQLASRLAPQQRLLGDVLVLEGRTAEGTVAKLEGQMNSSRADERRAACYQLGRSGSTRAVGLLYGALGDRDESVRHHALRALVHLHRDPSEPFPAGRVSLVALPLGGGFPKRKLVQLLKRANDPTESEWIWAATLLSLVRTPSALPELRKGSDHSYLPTRKAARAAIAAARGRSRRGSRPIPEDRRDPRSAAALLRRLRGRDPYRRAQAARLLARRNDVEPGPLLDALRAEKNAQVRAELLLALGRKGGPEVWALLLKNTENQDLPVRFASLRALSRCPEKRAVDRLLSILTGRGASADERNLAALSLGQIGSAYVVKRLSEYVGRTKMPISGSALALGLSGSPRAVPALAKCLEIKKESLKQYAYSGLSRIGTREAVDAMVAHHSEYDNTTRFCASSAIRRVRRQQGTDRLVALTRSGRAPVAAHGLEQCADPRAADVLIETLPKSKGTQLRLGLQALGRIGDPKAVPVLCALLKHKEDWVRWAAFRALRWRFHWHRPKVRAAVRRDPIFCKFLEKPPSLAGQKENTWVCRRWAIDLDDMRACTTTYEAGLVFDEAAGSALRWGAHGRRCDVPQLAETWLYNSSSNRWTECRPPIVPVGSCGSVGLSYDRAHRKVVSVQSTGGEHGWQWERNRALRESSPWIYDSSTDRWTPARPLKSPGCRKAGGLVYLQRHGVHFLFSGWHGDKATADRSWVYDLAANSWHMLAKPESGPPIGRIYPGMVYLPGRDKVLLVGGRYRKADNHVWLYDLRTNTWQDCGNRGDPPQFGSAVVRDGVSGDVLAFVTSPRKPAQVWRYSLAENKWARLPTAPEPTPHHASWDACHDPVNNVFLLDGGIFDLQHVDYIAVREVWTYKFKKQRDTGRTDALPAPEDIRVEVSRGRPRLTWKRVRGALGYRVYRGTGKLPWKVRYTPTVDRPLRGTSFTDRSRVPDGAGILFYCVTAVDRGGREGPPSLKVRLQPPVPRDVVVGVLPDRTVQIRWAKSPARGVVGYHIYAARLEPPGKLHAPAMKRLAKFERLTAKPVRSTRFADRRRLSAARGVFNHEVRAYVVRAVNALGVESGPSARVLSLTSSVPNVKACERLDGSTLVTWESVPEKAIRGYAVYRMDELRANLCLRLTPHPVRETSFVDRPDVPRAERRRYYVVAVDALDQEGAPSEGAWAFGRP